MGRSSGDRRILGRMWKTWFLAELAGVWVFLAASGAVAQCPVSVRADALDLEGTRLDLRLRITAPVDSLAQVNCVSALVACTPASTVSASPCQPTDWRQSYDNLTPERGLGTLYLAWDTGGEDPLEFTLAAGRDGATVTPAGFATAEAALAAYAPVLRLAANEVYRPDPVAVALNASVLLNRDGAAIPWPEDEPRAAFLGDHADRLGVLDLQNLDETAASYAALYVETLQNGSYAPTVYGTVASDPSRPGWTLLQYWFTFFYNDWENTHEGDWEHITVALDELGTVVGVAYAQHGYEFLVPAHAVERVAGHPVVYTALGSHASYPESGSTFVYVGTDRHPGDGAVYVPEDAGLSGEAYDLVLLPRMSDSGDEHSWVRFGGSWGEPGSNGARLFGPRPRATWVRPAPGLTLLAAGADRAPTAELQFTVTGPDRLFFGPTQAPGVAVPFERGEARVADPSVTLHWLTLRDWQPGAYSVTLSAVRDPGEVLLGVIDWNGLRVLHQGELPAAAIQFESQLPTPPPAFSPLVAHPNPFANVTTLNIREIHGPYSVEIFDAAGRRLRTLRGVAAGPDFVSWDGRDRFGRRVPPGVYFLRAVTGVVTRSARVTRIP